MGDLLGRRVRLVPVGPAEQEYVFQLERHPALITRWRGRGMVLSPSEAARTFWAGCAAAFVVVGVDSGPVGCVHLSNFEPVNGCIELSVLGDPRFEGAGLVVEGAGLAIDYAIDAWPLRKVYF